MTLTEGTLFMPRFRLSLALALALTATTFADDWPQWLGPRRDGVWRETDILDKFPPGGPKVQWRAEIGPGYTGPAVAGGRVYVMDHQGDPLPKGKEFVKGGLAGRERILCLDAADGKLLWKHEYDCTYKIAYPQGPRTTPVVHQGKVYTLGAMGDLLCLDALSGKVFWSKNFPADYKAKPQIWGWASHPLVDGDKLFCLVGGEGSAVVAFHKDTGKELWKALTVEEVGYAPPIITEAGGKRQLIAWHTEAVNALDPETGKLYWSEKHPADVPPERPGISTATPLRYGDMLFFTTPHHGALMLKLAADRPAATVVWRGKSNNLAKPDGLHALMGTPAIHDGHVYGICTFGELRCLKTETGERVWETYEATEGKKAMSATAFLVRQGERFFIFNDKGYLIIAQLTPKGYKEIDRAKLLEPTLYSRGREVVWSHPAFANRCVFARNGKEIICVALSKTTS